MTRCNICGSMINARYRAGKRQTLCTHCANNTPDKVDFDTFRFTLWTPEERTEYGRVPASIERAFYSDYIRSMQDLTDYCAGVVESEDISD